MNEQWFKEYVLLAFRMDNAIRKFTESRFVDYYYGPPEWKAEAQAEKSADELVRDAMALENALSEQGFEAHRATYLEKQVRALETVCRKLNGENFSLEEEVQLCFDIHPERIPESQFEQGLALLDEVLPGEGSLSDRLESWRKRYQLAREKSGLLLNFMQRAAAEARRRTQAFINLPADEGIATSACEMIFSPEEAEQWLAEHIYPEAGIEPDTIDIAKLRKAGELLDYPVGGNAAFLLHEGRSDEEVMQYLIKYLLLSDEEALKFLEYLKVPFQQAYIFTYFYGRQLMKPWLQRSDWLTVFSRFLTEQVYPSELVKEASS